ASFYSGQEGSFLLWTILTVVIGLMLQPYVRRHGYEQPVMLFFTLILCFLALMLVAKNPFAYLWETYADKGTTQEFINSIRGDLSRFNGKGLNPVLQNRWIMIHPPILFVGFAAMSVPFVFALAGLVKRDYQNWIRVAFPWALFGCAVLGFGIMLGGFWAYVTLGWGGFWAWDPVENSSLIPWLICVALVHTMLVQRKTKGLVKTNLVLAVFAFIAVLYSTFLTRSGVLGDTSVHSFVEPGKFVYALLLAFLIVFIVLGFGMILWRAKDIAKMNEPFDKSSREFNLSLGSALLVASALIVTLGTSYPIFAELIGKPKVAVEASFYNQMHIPLMIAVMLLNAFSLTVAWKRTSLQNILRRSIVPFAVAVVMTVLCVLIGVRTPEWLALVFGSWYTLTVNLSVAWQIIRRSPMNTGAYVSHTGVALLMLGIIATAGYTEESHVRLPYNDVVEIFGYKLRYVGKDQIEREYKDREKHRYFIQVEKDGRQDVVHPIVYYSDFNKRESPFLEPGIAWTVGKDLYVSPKAFDSEGEAPKATVMKGQSAAFPMDSTARIELLRFDMSEAQQSEMKGTLKLATVVNITEKGTTTEKKLYTYFDPQKNEFTPITVTLPNSTKQIALLKVKRDKDNPDLSTATYALMDTAVPSSIPKEVFVVDVSTKPFINLVWFGVITMVAGFIVSIIRHRNNFGTTGEPAR
ncbi:MAG: cytochrome c biogenesis protein CcsA, partial [Candidatus Kapabacteria bacterium]|nr:cytochrome c biogenesis protein CcsA [Candidatus Kapabacteria bacterium]